IFTYLSLHLQHLFHLLSFFFHTPATTEIYTLSLHDALPISMTSPALDIGIAHLARPGELQSGDRCVVKTSAQRTLIGVIDGVGRSEEHTSELQSRGHLVCRLLLEKKKIVNGHLSSSCQDKSL